MLPKRKSRNSHDQAFRDEERFVGERFLYLDRVGLVGGGEGGVCVDDDERRGRR